MKFRRILATFLAVALLSSCLILPTSAGTIDSRKRYDYGTPLDLDFNTVNLKDNGGDAGAPNLSFVTKARTDGVEGNAWWVKVQNENKGQFSFVIDNSKIGTKIYIAIEIMFEDFKQTIKIFDNESPADNEVDGAERIMNVNADGKLVILGGDLSQEGTEIQLQKKTWYKIEMYLDETANTVTAFVNDEKVVDKGAWAGEGFNNFHMDVKGVEAGGSSEFWVQTLKILTYDSVPGEEVVAPAYTASLSGAASAKVGDTLTYTVTVDKTFAAGEVVLGYDDALLTPPTGDNYKVDAENKTVTVVVYGEDKTSFSVPFTAKAVGEATVTLNAAAFGTKEDAENKNLTESAVDAAGVKTVITTDYTVSLPDRFSGNSTVPHGEDYTFTATDPYYDYSDVAATMGGEKVDVVIGENNTYTVENVTGDLVITATVTPKTYSISFIGNGATDVVGHTAIPTYGTPYVLTLPVSNDSYTYTVTVKIGNGEPFPVTGATYTIDGADVIGNISVSVEKEEVVPEEVNVSLSENSDNSAVVDFATTVNKGASYTLTLNPALGYKYSVTATMGGETVTVTDNGDNTYTVASVTADLVFTVTSTLDKDGVSVTEYLRLDGTAMWLVRVEGTLAENNVYTYGGSAMLLSEKYGAYAWLVVAEELSLEDAKAQIGVTTGRATKVDYGMDVNMSGTVDANDAQLVYNMYTCAYEGISETVTVEKYLRADVNDTVGVNTQDAVAIVNAILQGNS